MEGDRVHGGGRGAWRGTGCTEGDGVCGGGRGAQLRTGTAAGDGAADHAHAQGGPAASPLGFPRRRCYKRWNNPGKPGSRACRGRRLDGTHLSLTCTRPSSSCPACPARSAASSGSAACATARCRRSSICLLSGSAVSCSFVENGCGVRRGHAVSPAQQSPALAAGSTRKRPVLPPAHGLRWSVSPGRHPACPQEAGGAKVAGPVPLT